MENLWGVLLGAVIAAVAGLVGLVISKKNEHEQWTRNQKLEVYANVIKAFDELHYTRSQDADKLLERALKINDAVARVILLAPRGVFAKCAKAQEAAFAKHSDSDNKSKDLASSRALAELKTALRTDLHSEGSIAEAGWLKFASRNLRP